MATKSSPIEVNEPIFREAASAGEPLLVATRLHWIFVAKGLAWLGGFFMLGSLLSRGFLHVTVLLHAQGMERMSYFVYSVGEYVQTVCIGLGAVIFLIYLSAFMTTRIGLTSRRLFMRKGLVFIKMFNIDIEEIKGEYVDHGLLGRVFDYGEIHMDARFVRDFYVPNIPQPYRLIRALNEARARAGDTVVVSKAPLQTHPDDVAPQPALPPGRELTPPPPAPAAPAPAALAPSGAYIVVPLAGMTAQEVQNVRHAAAAVTGEPVRQERAEAGMKVIDVEALMPEPEPEPEPQTPHTVNELDSVSQTFTDNAEPPAQVLEETEDYVIVKKKKAD